MCVFLISTGIRFLRTPQMGAASSFIAIILLLVQGNWMSQVAGHDDNFHIHAWPEFRQLSGYGKGQTHAVVPSLKRYLHHFGYLETVDHTGFSHVFDEDLEAAIKKYQLFFNLNDTGVLDVPTVHQLLQPRCGVRDIIKGPAPEKFHQINVTGNSSSMLYGLANGRWPPSSRYLLYHIWTNEYLPYPIGDVSAVFRSAFNAWAMVSPFQFSGTWQAAAADIQIGFFQGTHMNCPRSFEGLGAFELAHSFEPPTGDCHFNAVHNWMIDPRRLQATRGSYDLQSVAIHEIGHILGLAHSSIPDAIMYPYTVPQARKVQLHADDIAGINALYPQG